MFAALLALAAPLFAQPQAAPAPAPAQAQVQAPAVSTDTAVNLSGSTTTAAAPEAAPPPPPPKPVKHIQVNIHPDATSWEPVSLFGGGDPDKIATRFSCRLRKHVSKSAAAASVDGQAAAAVESGKPVVTYKGASMSATAVARVYPVGEDRQLVVSVHPKGLAAKGIFVEVRFKIVEGFLEEAKVAQITVGPGSGLALAREDSGTLSKKGISYSEDFPSSGRIGVSAISLKPGGLNAGTVSLAAFADKELETTNFAWSATVSRK